MPATGCTAPRRTSSAAAARAAAAAPAAAPTWVPSGSPLRRALLRSLRTSLPQLLRYADRNSMAHSIEVRLPFLDRRVAEFALSLAPRDPLPRRLPQAGAARCRARGVPAEVLARRDKVGYETPEAQWFGSGAGRARIAEILLDRAAAAGAGFYERTAIERDLAAGAWRDAHGIWRAVNAELWLRARAAAPVALA